jgi:glycosyltransferase involved in cell wall biosynthesis
MTQVAAERGLPGEERAGSAGPVRHRIVHLANTGFALSYIRGQAAYMRARGGLALSAVTPPSQQLDAFGQSERVPVHAVDLPRRITPFRDLVAVGRLVRHFRSVRPAIVHGHTPKGGLLGMLAAKIARVPVRVYTLHGLVHMTASGATRRLLMTSDRLACALADRVICVSESVRQVAIDEGICPEDKIIVLGSGSTNGVDAEGRYNPALVTPEARRYVRARHGIAPDDVVVGFVGRIVRDKGIEPLAEAWRDVRVRHPHARLMLIGPEETRDAVPPEVLERLRADPSVVMVGEEYDLAPYFANMDLLVLPSWREGFGNVLIEAAGMAIPTVATAIPGCVNAVRDGETGTLVEPRDAGALGEAIERYLDDADLRRDHGAAGRSWVLRAFRPKDVWESIYQEYAALLSARGLAVAGDSARIDASAVASRRHGVAE